MSEKVKFTVEMDVTVPQALALKAMFEYWNYLSNIGSSRHISFYVDGNGNFHPNCKVSTDKEIPELTEKLRWLAMDTEISGNNGFDFDCVAGELKRDSRGDNYE